MNVLVLTSSFPRYVGDPAGNFLCELAKQKERGFQIVVLCPHHSDTKFREYLCGSNVYRFPYFYPFSLQKLCHNGGIVYNLKNTLLAKLQVPFFFLSELLYTMKMIKKERIDLINSHWLIPQGLVGAICKRLFGIPNIVTIHSSGITMVKKIPVGKKIAGFIVRNSDIIISVSSHRADELLSFVSGDTAEIVKNRFQIIPMGIDSGEFRNKMNRKDELRAKYSICRKSVVLFVGRLVEVKGCEYLINGFKSVAEKFGDVELVIVGAGPLESHLRETVQDLHIKEYVRFEGFVEHSKVKDYYCLSDVVVFPSIVDSAGYQEGLPIALLEALAAGKPIVSSRTKGFIETIKDGWNGFLVEPKNPEQIADKVLHLLNDKKLRATFSENALESSKKYDSNVITGKYVKIFREIRVL